MFSLPSLAPQDSYTLWYTSSTTPNPSAFAEPPAHAPHDNTTAHQLSRRHLPSYRTPLARLRHDEDYMERRKGNIQNYGSGWIKPPGIPKSLHQIREEKREMEEHQEALRREALAQELAEAEEAEAIEELDATAEGFTQARLRGEDGEVVQDLDDEIPDADETAILDSSTSEDSEDSELEGTQHEGFVDNGAAYLRNVQASRVPDDVFREALVRGEEVRQSLFTDDGDEEEGGENLLQEEDLVRERRGHQQEHDVDMGMDADLDADIPEAEAGGYEHTDTEEELTSSEEDSADESQLPRRQAATSMVRSDGTQNSMDLSNLMSGSSQMSSSPRRLSAGLRDNRRGPGGRRS
ncbi:hypothetical protein QTJ16_006279 [Diplocarpon rosae]|uniref:Uncharacterized protein n=1 Tax=Diplocarpon rosae TaxID=946125 RepID=A0AAD9SWC0_9HELO|nr:hypothetical protein QTJ16_006279 [Diplocarpon rosae]PBP28167.1 hypothetical protein BUE80_DR001012 [Diplocarpon rosae]